MIKFPDQGWNLGPMHEELNLGHWIIGQVSNCETLEQEEFHPSFPLATGATAIMLMGDIHRKRVTVLASMEGGGTNRKLSGLFLGKIPR